MTTKGRRQIGPYMEITEDYQRDVRRALGERTQKWLAEKADCDASAVSWLLDPERVGKTSRIIKKVSAVLKIPLPQSETDLDGKKLARLKAKNPTKYKLVHDLIEALDSGEE